MTTVVEVQTALAGYSFRSIPSEAVVQEALERVFIASGLTFEREKRLNVYSRVDFWFPDGEGKGLALEVKVGGSTTELLRQLSRYAEIEAVRELVLVTPLLRLRVPPLLNGKKTSKLWPMGGGS